MRRILPEPAKIGDTRVRGRFLFLPMTIDRERRWLEYARWREEMIPTQQPGCTMRWVAMRWLS